MQPHSATFRLPGDDASDAAALRSRALQLAHASQAGLAATLLRGKNIGLLSTGDDAVGDGTLLLHAAAGLGAHVARLPSSLGEDSPPQEVDHTARMLGRLYDAVVCQGLPAALVRRIRDSAGVPVLDGTTSWDHAASLLAQVEPNPGQDPRRFAVQAALFAAMS
ncbi:Rossmann-fold NAD(P)-binding domain-containing protein [Piscinibacter terrae]|uniref:Ornithine carbamoyltransferase n=1 Tax=Piscinibacter terrae TaxID=2496871 RepID=A0A3N7HUE4_9BURK|nr:ornithine carbamoyltransferase [Albitalea terrae]RQP24926.1 ornithine carbamoyltransferase [Albitalea terrae]